MGMCVCVCGGGGIESLFLECKIILNSHLRITVNNEVELPGGFHEMRRLNWTHI